MKQVFRIMDMPDRVIAFDELPQRLLQGFELCRADGFPRHWKEWLGKTKKITNIPPEKDFLTGAIRKFEPIVEEDSFFYLVDWTVNPVVEKWKEVCDYVKQHVDKDVRLTEKIDDMALPLAQNKTDSVTLEPEDVVIITVPKENDIILPVASSKANVVNEPVKEEKLRKTPPSTMQKCEECEKTFEGSYSKAAIRMHKIKVHPKKEEVAI